jgi:hypothetical protein
MHSFDNPHQYFWKCEHHPVATQNFFEHRATCEWGCHTQELRWHHSGFSPQVPELR